MKICWEHEIPIFAALKRIFGAAWMCSIGRISIKASQESLVSHLEHLFQWYHTQCRKPSSLVIQQDFIFRFVLLSTTSLRKTIWGVGWNCEFQEAYFLTDNDDNIRPQWYYQYIGRNSSRRIDLSTHVVKVGINLDWRRYMFLETFHYLGKHRIMPPSVVALQSGYE